jgi:uncharacterized protein (TIGR02231 family)
MKKVLYIALVFISALALAKQVPSKVSAITVFQSRAEVTRKATIDLPSGEQELVFSGISTAIDPNNIQVKGTGNLVILGISYRQNYLNENELPADLQTIKDKIAALDLAIKKLANAKSAFDAERKLLEANQQIGGTQQNITLEQLKAIAGYYNSRMAAMANEQLTIQEEINAKNEELRKLRAHYNDRTSQFSRNSGEIVVMVDAKASTKANLDITYMVSGAGWRAEYDIRAEEVDAPLTLIYRAVITQNTGENWDNVNLVLSTGDPNVSIIKPDMNPQYVDFYYANQNVMNALRGKASGVQISGFNDMRSAAPMADEVMEEAPIEDLAFASETKTLYTNYTIDRPYSLASGNKPLTVTIKDQQVAADYEYQSVPKLRNRVFLIAKAKNWGELVLLPGPMNIFFEGGYVGKSYMNPNVTSDNLPISLGYDPGINIERKLVTDLSSKKTIGTNQKETYAYEILIRNNKRKDIKVVIQDQIPVAQHSDIKVENVEIGGGGLLDDKTGEIKWTVEVPTAKQVKRQFSFDVRYPKGQTVSGL